MVPFFGNVWDWSGYDSISFSYYNSVAQIGTGSQTVHLRFNLSDYGDADTSYTGLGEYYYSFHYILDNDPGWNTITMPLERNDSWDGSGFNLTGWSGDAGNGELDKDAIGGFHLEFSIDGGGDGSYNYGTIVLDDLKLTGEEECETTEFAVTCDGGSYYTEVSWTVTNSLDTTEVLLAGGASFGSMAVVLDVNHCTFAAGACRPMVPWGCM